MADVVDAASVFGAATSAEIVLPSLVGVGLAVMHPAAMLAVDALSRVLGNLLGIRPALVIMAS